MKLPDVKSLKDRLSTLGSKSSSSGVSLKAPRILADLYADLRDRRLLPLMALLIVCVVAAPFLLGGDDESEPPMPPPPAATADQASQAGFTVVPSQVGLRDYRERLGDREPRDPFAAPGQSSSISAPSEASESSADSSGGGEPESSGSAPGSVESAPVEPTPEYTPAPEKTTETTTGVVIERVLKRYEIEFKSGFLEQRKIGVAENLKLHTGVAPVAQLPNKKNPAVTFIGLTSDKKRALFLMSTDVTAYFGDGHCAFDRDSCQVLALAPDQSATFAIGFGDTRFKLNLRQIIPVYETRSDSASVTRESETDR